MCRCMCGFLDAMEAPYACQRSDTRSNKEPRQVFFFVARCSPIFSLSETALIVVALTGAITSLFAATIGLVQNDIKRIIAYSTISQLGYMFLAAGVGAYTA